MGVIRLKTLLLLVGLTAQGVVSQDPPPTVYRLPPNITPRLYMIQLDPDMDTGVIKGSIRIEVNTTSNETQTLDSITMHLGRNVVVNDQTATIINMDGSIQEIGALVYDDANSLLSLELPEQQTLNYSHVYVISLHFRSVLNNESKGLFTGYFNSTSKYIASNFRPTHAREVFPCFDEPHYKVPVALQVWRPASYHAVSTADRISSSKISPDNKVLDVFANTGPISIHSLGLFIGQQLPVGSMGVQVVVPPPLPTTVPYLDTLISNVMQGFGQFPTPFYLIVLPDRTHTSFSSYGFVFTSPEVYLREVGSPLQWTSLQLQLTEEFLRQFLEFSKTPQWWSDLWLSESIGAFLSLPLQQNEPWLHDWLKIVIRSEALGSYINATGPVITSPDLTKWDIENLISNQTVKVKGLSTLLMWADTMPKGLVVDTLLEFIKPPQSVVTTDDLMTLLETNIRANTTYDVTPAIPLMTNWLTQPGVPLVWFSIDSDSTFTLTQGTPCSAGPAPALRSISVALAEGSAPDWDNILQGRWLLNSSTQYPFVNISQSSVINIEAAPYRVNYPASQWTALLKPLSSGWAPASVASALQDDAMALSLDGCLDFSVALSFLNSTQHSGLDWWPVVKASEAITANIGDDLYGRSAFGIYFASLFTADLLDKLDLRQSASHPELSVARELVTPWLCRFNISTCREAVVELGGPLWQGNTSGIAGSDLKNVACYGGRYTPGALGPLLSAYQGAENALLRSYFTIALSCLIDQDSVIELLNVTVSSNRSSSQAFLRSEDSQATLHQSDAQQILIGLASSLENSQTVMNVIINHRSDIQDKFGVSTLSSVIKNLAKNRVDLSQLSSLQNDTYLDPYVVQSVSEAIAISKISQTWYSDYSSQLYADLPAGDVTTTTLPATTSSSITTPTLTSSTSITTSPAITTSTTTTTSAPPGPGPTSTTTPAPGGASALSDCRVFTLALMALLITLDFTLQ